MILLQALAKPGGQAGLCFHAVETGLVRLAISSSTLLEVEDVLSRPHLRSRVFTVTDSEVGNFLDLVLRVSLLIANVPLV